VKAAVLNTLGQPPRYEDFADPHAIEGEVLVRASSLSHILERWFRMNPLEPLKKTDRLWRFSFCRRSPHLNTAIRARPRGAGKRWATDMERPFVM
jgi:hypothetical protein